MYESTLGPEAIEYCRDYLGECPETSKAAISHIQKFIEDNPEIRARKDLKTILCFLRSCKFRIEQTEIKIRK
jgi:hypothetical protein